jgi:hypothetical protein
MMQKSCSKNESERRKRHLAVSLNGRENERTKGKKIRDVESRSWLSPFISSKRETGRHVQRHHCQVQSVVTLLEGVTGVEKAGREMRP